MQFVSIFPPQAMLRIAPARWPQGSSRPRSLASLWRHPAARHHGLGSPLLERSVVEIGVRPGRQHFECQRRWLREVAHGDLHGTGLDPSEQALKPRNIHGLGKTIADGLTDKRMIWDLALTYKISPHRRSGRGIPPRSGPRRPCRPIAVAPSCRRESAAARARHRSPNASAW